MGIFDKEKEPSKAPVAIETSGSIFDKVGQKSLGDKIRAGLYLLEIARMRHGSSNEGKGEYIAVEFTVKEAVPQEGSAVPPNAVGSKVTELYMESYGTIAMDNYRKLLGVLIDKNPSARTHQPGYLLPEGWADVAKQGCAGDGMHFAGRTVRCKATNEIAQRSRKEFVKTVFKKAE